MQLYEGMRYPLTMEIPATWEDITAFDGSCPGTRFAADEGFLVVVEENMAALMGEAGWPIDSRPLIRYTSN